MILYHGGSLNFNKFIISKDLIKHDVIILPEGLGVYMTDKKELAKSYGNIIYTLEVEKILNFTTKKSIYKIVNDFLKVYDTNRVIKRALKSQLLYETMEGILSGDRSITGLIKELWNLSEENIYSLNLKFDLYEYLDFLELDWKQFLETGVIKYNDKTLGIIYIAKNSDLIKIIKKDVI